MRRTSVLVHVDGLDRLPPREDDGVVLVVRLPLPEKDGPRQLHLVLLHDAAPGLVVADEHGVVPAVLA